jgi:glutathione S-transferase
MLLHGMLSNSQAPEPAKAAATYMGGKYGYGQAEAEAAPRRVAQIVRNLSARLEQQQARGSQFLIGDTLSALDIYWSTFAVLVQPLPADLCPIDEQIRASFVNTDPLIAEALSPKLLEHRDRIYRDYLELPMNL